MMGEIASFNSAAYFCPLPGEKSPKHRREGQNRDLAPIFLCGSGELSYILAREPENLI
jgi:hypothetical protein